MNVATCSENDPKSYAYEATKECSTQEPDPNGNFDTDEMKKNIYKCGPNAYFDTNTDKARCVTEDKCSETPGVVAFADGQFGKRCITTGECWALGKYTDAAIRVCVSECPEGCARGRDGAGNRVCVCQRGLLFDAEKNLCVPQK